MYMYCGRLVDLYYQTQYKVYMQSYMYNFAREEKNTQGQDDIAVEKMFNILCFIRSKSHAMEHLCNGDVCIIYMISLL